MPPNFVDPPMHDEENGMGRPKDMGPMPPPVNRSEGNYNLKIFQSILNLLSHILIGGVVGTSILFAFRAGLPLTATPLHIVLCVVGYHLLMAEAILSLSSGNGWSSYLRLVEKRRAHWILQIGGSGLAIAGSFIKILDKTVHWDSLHGRFALVALVFTSVSLFNGLASLWAYEVRRFLPGNVSKLSHICFGTVAFSAATITLCYGFDKALFRNWATSALTDTLIAFTAILTFIIIVNPLITFYSKVRVVIKQ